MAVLTAVKGFILIAVIGCLLRFSIFVKTMKTLGCSESGWLFDSDEKSLLLYALIDDGHDLEEIL